MASCLLHDEPDIRERLAALARPEGIKLLNELYQRLGSLKAGVDAERFRVAFKDERDHIRRLTNWFMREIGDARRAYRPTLMALPLLEDERARQMLALVDGVLIYLAAELERRTAERNVTIAELAAALEVPEEQVADALGYLFEGPMSAGRALGFPEGAQWHVIPNEQSLDYPNVQALLRQMAEWAEGAATRSFILPSEGQLPSTAMPRTEPPPLWIKKNWKTVAGWVGGFAAFAASVLAIIEFFAG
jgi:hypothetical protein